MPVLAGVPVNVPDKPDNPAGSTPSVLDMIPVENPDKAVLLALTERAASAEGEAAALWQWVEGAEERLRAEALRAEGEAARIQLAEAKATAEGLRLALAEARRPFRRRWIG